MPWWPGVLGAWIFLVLGLAVLIPVGERPFDPLLSLDLSYGFSGWILDPLMRGLLSWGFDCSILRGIFFLFSGLGVLCLGLALSSRLELLPLSLVLFLLGTWPWAVRDPASLLAAPHHLRLLFLGLMALALQGRGLGAILIPFVLGWLRQSLVGGGDWQIDVLFLFLIYSILHGSSWNSRGKNALRGLGLFATSVFLSRSLGLESGRVSPPMGLSGFEDTQVDFGAILLYSPGFLLFSSGLIWILLASRRRRLGRIFSSTLLYALLLVLFISTFSQARFLFPAQDEIQSRDRKALVAALPDPVPQQGLLLINLPVHLRPYLLSVVGSEHWSRLKKLDTWDSGSEVYLPPDLDTTHGMVALRYGPMGPMRVKPATLELLDSFPRARMLSHRAKPFPTRLEEMVALGKMPPYIGSQDVESFLVALLAKEGREVSESAELPELDPTSVRMRVEVQEQALTLSFTSDASRSFVVAASMGRGQLEAFEVDRDAVQSASFGSVRSVLDYYQSLARRVGSEPDTDGYKIGSMQGLEVSPFGWVPGYGPVFLVKKAAGGEASFTFEADVER